MDTKREPTFHYWIELPEAEPVEFDDLPMLMARAQHSDTFAQAGAELNFEEALGRMVEAGTLQVRDPLTLGRHTFPMGESLRRAVLLPIEDVRPLLASFRIGLRLIPYGTGPTHWTIENAAASIGTQKGFHGGAVRTLQEQMVSAASDGALTVRHPHTDLPFRPDTVRAFYELVTPVDVNSWLDRQSAGYLWSPVGVAAPVVPDPSPEVSNKANEKSDPERRLAALRALGGSAKWKQQAWRFTRITELVRQERGRPRSTEKTIRADLREAAQAESDARRNGEVQPTGLNWTSPA